MNHIAFLKKKYGYIEKILKKEKTIESRWYVNRIAPWNAIKTGDTVYFKESGMPVSIKAEVAEVQQYSNLENNKVLEVYHKYGKKIFPEVNSKDYIKYTKNKEKKNYCILIFLKNPIKIKPFNINKKGYGNACAWMVVNDIQNIKTNS